MLKHATVAGFALVFVGLAGSANAQSALSSCDPVTGTTPSGAPCVELTPIDPNTVNRGFVGANDPRYKPLDTTTLGQTYRCEERDARDQQYGNGGTLLIENCGALLSSSELGPLTPFLGTTGAPVAPVAVAPIAVPAAPAIIAPVAPAVAAPAFAAVPVTAGAGLGGVGLAATALGAAVLVGAVVLIADDDDDNSTNATNGSN